MVVTVPNKKYKLPAIRAFRLVDAHVHLFPNKLFQAIWDWFEKNAWPIVQRLHSESILTQLKASGITAAFGLSYAHRPGLAEYLNSFMANLAQRHPILIPFGTIMPGEPNEERILNRAFEDYCLRGIKIHCHVQRVAPDSKTMNATCRSVCDHDGILIIHAGRAPALLSQRDRISEICNVARTKKMLERFPNMKTIVPHHLV